MNFILNNFSRFFYAFVAFILILTSLTILRRCSGSPETEAPALTETAILAAKKNKEIETLYSRVESLERHVDSLTILIEQKETQRNENFRNTPNQSVLQHYRDLSDRYTNKPAKR